MNKLLTSTIAFSLWFSQSSVLWAQEIYKPAPEPDSPGPSILREEAWNPHHLFLEWGIPAAGFNLSYQVFQDWAIDLGWGFYDPFTYGSYLSLAGRYYFPETWTQDLFAFRISRFYWEGIGRTGFQIVSSEGRQFGVGSALGFETRWGDLTTRLGIQIDQGFNGRPHEGVSIFFPVVKVGYEIPWSSQSAYSELYLAEKTRFLETRLAPLVEIQSGSSLTQGSHLAFMLASDQVGIGLYKSRDIARRGDLSEETLGLFGRYYFAPIHPGLQSYLEGVGNFQGTTRFSARLGIEHREPWGGVINLSLGTGVEKPHEKPDYGVTFEVSSALGYYWSLTPLGLMFDSQ